MVVLLLFHKQYFGAESFEQFIIIIITIIIIVIILHIL